MTFVDGQYKEAKDVVREIAALALSGRILAKEGMPLPGEDSAYKAVRRGNSLRRN